MSESLTLSDLERLYSEVVLKQDFYNDSYGSDWNLEPYEAMAQLLHHVVAPSKHIDIGCGKAFLVLAMRRLGVASFGLDFSEALVKQAPAEVKPYVNVARTEDWIRNPLFLDADLITYMEVFEHLPVRVTQGVLEKLHPSFRGRLLVTTPSYGIDERWKLGIVTNPDPPSWQEDMLANRPFRQIVLLDGVPHHGHITLCSYRWWTEFFLCNGWVRSIDLEQRISKAFGAILAKYHWNPYLLERFPADVFEVDPAASNQLGAGWHEAEIGSMTTAGRWTNGRAEIYLNSTMRNWSAVQIVFTAPSINVVRDYTLAIVVERQVRTDQYELRWAPVFASAPLAVGERGKMATVEIGMEWSAAETVSLDGHAVFRLTVVSPSYCPSDYGLSADSRSLGLFLHKILLKNDL